MNEKKTEVKSRFDGYVIPDHLKQIKPRNSETIRIWMVELTLTSGEVHDFYIKAKDYEDAQQKAHNYSYLAETPQQLRKGFMLRN